MIRTTNKRSSIHSFSLFSTRATRINNRKKIVDVVQSADVQSRLSNSRSRIQDAVVAIVLSLVMAVAPISEINHHVSITSHKLK